MKKIYLLIIFLIIVMAFLVLKLDFFNKFSYDLINKNKTVKAFPDAIAVLNNYKLIDKENLPFSIKSKFNEKGLYLEIPKGDLQRKIILDTRLNQLVTPSLRLQEAWFLAKGNAYLSVDVSLIKKMFELQNYLTAYGYRSSEITITSCHRSKEDNDNARGAISSMHLFGKAFDISVGDINSDGVINIADKDIVYNILDKKVINNSGGVGYYSFSKTALHFDVRGKRARWDQYKRK